MSSMSFSVSRLKRSVSFIRELIFAFVQSSGGYLPDYFRALRRIMARAHPPRRNASAAELSEDLLALLCLDSG